MTNPRSSFLVLTVWGCFLCFLLHNAALAAAGVTEGLFLCAARLIPALFPVSVCAAFAQSTGICHLIGSRLCCLTRDRLRLGADGWGAFCIGLVSGFPVGAQTVFSLYRQGRIGTKQMQRLAGCCNNAGPAFLIGYIGVSLFKSPLLGFLLFLCQTLSAVILLRLSADEGEESSVPVDLPPACSQSAAFSAAVKTAVSGTLTVCGFVVFFCVVCKALNAALETLHLHGDVLPALLCAPLELSTGCAACVNLPCGALIAAALCGWSGLCVHMQTAAFAPRAFSMGRYIRQKALHAVCTAAIFSVFFLCLPYTVQKIPLLTLQQSTADFMQYTFSVLLPALLLLLLLFLPRRKSTAKKGAR